MAFKLMKNTVIELNQPDSKPLQNAVRMFRRDLANTLLDSEEDLQSSIYVDAAAGHGLACEQFEIKVESGERLVIRAGDELGGIYGLLYISEKYLGVKPFWFWHDQLFYKQDYVEIPEGCYRSKPQRVRFRGWFVNDEVLLSEWQIDGSSDEVWRMVFETLLRCGGNMAIPGTDLNSKKNRHLAVEMGLWITHHHAEPLGAEMFARVYPDQAPSYLEHPDLFEELWEQAILAQKDHKVVWNVGFRGQGDRPFWSDDRRFNTPEERGKLISRIMRRQCELIREYVANPVFCTNLYGEILELYRAGHLDIPDDVIKIWGDSGYGKMVSRRQGNHNPRHNALADPDDPGLNGIYYHASFYDLQASSHIAMIPNSPELLADELNQCLERLMDQYWIINCGNVKPHSYILDLIRELWTEGTIDVAQHRRDFLEVFYPQSFVEDISRLFDAYFASTIHYGVHPDEKAGEQFYHHPARELIAACLCGETEQTLMRLYWATGKIGFREQIKWFKAKCAAAVAGWQDLAEQCRKLQDQMPAPFSHVFFAMLGVQVEIHYTGCKGFVALCDSLLALLDRDYVQAFVLAGDALTAYTQGVKAMDQAEHGHWQGYYYNDCLTNVKLTVYCCDTLRRYIRMLGDGPSFHSWERNYLYDAGDQKIVLLTNTNNHLSDDELYLKLKNKLGGSE